MHSLELMHANSAILIMVGQRAMDTVAEMKFRSIKKSAVKLGSNQSFELRRKLSKRTTCGLSLKRGLDGDRRGRELPGPGREK